MENFNLRKYITEGILLKEEQTSLFPDDSQLSPEELDFHSLTYDERVEFLKNQIGWTDELINDPEYKEAIKNGDLKTLTDIIKQRLKVQTDSGKALYKSKIQDIAQNLKDDSELMSLIQNLKKSKGNDKNKNKLKRIISAKIKSQISSEDVPYYVDIISMLVTGDLSNNFYVKRNQYGEPIKY